MKRKILSLILCTAMLICTLPATSLAEENATPVGAKLGIENGDTVTYAGKDGKSVKWRVVDKDKSNTGDTDGMLLLSDDTFVTVTSSPYSVTWSTTDCNKFYNDYFSDLYQKAVMKVTKTDNYYNYNDYSFGGELPTGTTVFALSIDEFNSLKNGLGAFNDGTSWWLRSADTINYYNLIYAYAYVTGNGNLSYMNYQVPSENTSYKIRPAVNLSKSKLASIDGKLLLLPAGEFSDANGKLASVVGTQNLWKLSTKSDVELKSAYSVDNTKDGLTLEIKTENAVNGCIGAIIMKQDGSVSHYARYPINDTELTQKVVLPSEVDADTDTMFVFYENYQGALPGEIGTAKKICLKHDYKYESLGENSHKATCTSCGYSFTEAHSFSDYTTTLQTHTHNCTVCGFEKTENHTYPAINGLATETEILCSTCNAAYFSSFKGELDSDRIRDAYVTNTEEYYKNTDSQTELNADGDKKLTLTFKTKFPIVAKGFQINQTERNSQLPETITLYGKNEADENYTEIGTVLYRSLFGESNADGKYTFTFTQKTAFSAYDSYKAEMTFNAEDYQTEQPFCLKFFGLISDAPIAKASFENLDGIVATFAPENMYPGEDYYATFIGKNGYPAREGTFSLTSGDLQSDSRWKYFPETGTIKVMKNFITDGSDYKFKCELYPGEKYVNIKLNSETLTLTDAEPYQALFGEEYVTGFNTNSGEAAYAPTMADITVTDNEKKDITSSCYLDNEGKLHIPSSFIKGNEMNITADEAGYKHNSDIKYKASIEQDGITNVRYFTDIKSAKKIIELNRDTKISLGDEIESTDMPSEPIKLENKKVAINLNARTLPNGDGDLIFQIANNADVTINDGTVAPKENGYTDQFATVDSSLLTLNAVRAGAFGSGTFKITATNNSKIVVDNSFQGESYIDNITMNSNSALELKGGTIGTLRLLSDNVKPKFYSGTTVKDAAAMDENNSYFKFDWFSALDDGCVFELDANNSQQYFKNLAMGYYGVSFNVKKAESTVTEQPQDITVEYKNAAELTVGAKEGSTYRWECTNSDDTGSIVETGSDTTNTLKIKDTAKVGKYTFYCAVMTDNLVSRSRVATVLIKCSHNDSKSINDDGVCTICQQRMVAESTINGEKVYLANLNDIADFASKNPGATIKLLADMQPGEICTFGGSDITLDLNGKTITVHNDTHIALTGTLTITGNGTIMRFDETPYDGLKARNDGVITVEISGNLTVENGNIFSICKNEGGTLSINGGDISALTSKGAGTTLNGGVFYKIFAENVTNYASLLGKGKAYCCGGKFDSSGYEYKTCVDSNGDATAIYNGGQIQIKDAPFEITSAPVDKRIPEGAAETIAVEVKQNEEYPGDIKYEWFVGKFVFDENGNPLYDADGKRKVEFGEVISATSSATIDTENVNGEKRIYRCTVSYNSSNSGEYALVCDTTFIVGAGTPVISMENSTVECHGNDCVVVFSAYNNTENSSELVAAVYKEVTAEEEIVHLEELGELLAKQLTGSFTHLKLFVWNNLDDMTPLVEPYDVFSE